MLRWGVLGLANIATRHVIPAMKKSQRSEVVAVASRDPEKARRFAASQGIPKAHGSYEELLDDPEIDAVYIPLPNHLHVPWSAMAAAAGKHVLCEKPIALNAAEVRELIAARDRYNVLIQEAFMVRTHPQWLGVRALLREGRIGELRAIQSSFAYFLDDPGNVRNMVDLGGGGLYDIGCYPVTTSRFLFEEEPRRALALVERDPTMRVDRLVSAILDFPRGQSLFVCGTQLVPYQRTQILGTRGRIEIEIPFNAPSDRPCRIFVDDGRDVFGGGVETIGYNTVNQYVLEVDAFASAILDRAAPPIPLEDSLANMHVLDALFRSADSGRWEDVAAGT